MTTEEVIDYIAERIDPGDFVYFLLDNALMDYDDLLDLLEHIISDNKDTIEDALPIL